MRASRSALANLFEPQRVVHLVRALIVALLSLVVTTLVLTTKRGALAAAWSALTSVA